MTASSAPDRFDRWSADRLEALADRLRATPELVRLDAGPLGEVAAYLPGARIPGIRLLEDGRVEVHAVMSLHTTVDRLEEAVLEAAGEDRALVDLVVSDVADPDAPAEDELPGSIGSEGGHGADDVPGGGGVRGDATAHPR